jgi:hypothetical protein
MEELRLIPPIRGYKNPTEHKGMEVIQRENLLVQETAPELHPVRIILDQGKADLMAPIAHLKVILPLQDHIHHLRVIPVVQEAAGAVQEVVVEEAAAALPVEGDKIK